jgi:hypothetical protein
VPNVCTCQIKTSKNHSKLPEGVTNEIIMRTEDEETEKMRTWLALDRTEANLTSRRSKNGQAMGPNGQDFQKEAYRDGKHTGTRPEANSATLNLDLTLTGGFS